LFEKTHKVVLKSFQAFIHILIWVIFSCGLVMAQDSGDLGTIELPNPSSVTSQYTYDPTTDRYIFSQEIGGYPISTPLVLTVKEYEALVLKEKMQFFPNCT